eukprot:2366686-Prymnesium_polylepis.2
MQHPEVLPAVDKELTFWGNFFSPKRRPGREEVMSDYLHKFPKIAPGDFKVTGEVRRPRARTPGARGRRGHHTAACAVNPPTPGSEPTSCPMPHAWHQATPGYLYCATCPTYILKYIPKVRFIFTLRNPVVRAFSEYLNKVADKTVMRYLHKRIDNKMEKDLSTFAPPFARLVDDVARSTFRSDSNRALFVRACSRLDRRSESLR